VWDAFIFAFTIPNLFRRLFGEGALSAAFIPTLSSYLNEKSRSETIRFINIIITLLFGVLCIIAGLVILTTFIIPIVAPSFVESSKMFSPIFLKLLRIMIPYLPLICLVALLQAVLNSLKHFMMPALASVVLNICWIAGFIIAGQVSTTDENKVTIIAWAILIGGLFEVIIQIPPLIKNKITYKPEISFNHPGLKEVLRLMLPTILGLAVFQINLMFDYIIAQIFIPESGAISALYYGNRMMQFPFALIGVSLATAVFPFLADYAARKDLKGMFNELTKALRIALFVGLPASVGLIILAEPIIHWSFYTMPASLFHIKAFSTEAVFRTSNVLVFYAIGIWSYGAVQIINRAFYSLKDMTTPVKVGIYTVVINLVLNIILVMPLKESGIALATTISSILNLIVLLYILNKVAVPMSSGRLLLSFFTGLLSPLICSLLMGVVCYVGLHYLPRGETLLAETIITITLVVLGSISYLGFSYLFQRSILKEIIHPVRDI
ncbi:MAG: murein biosynthesis integral membrane protein MurJ, partial [Planctomycetota bacterium]